MILVVKIRNVINTDPNSTDPILLGSATRHSKRILDHVERIQKVLFLPSLSESKQLRERFIKSEILQ